MVAARRLRHRAPGPAHQGGRRRPRARPAQMTVPLRPLARTHPRGEQGQAPLVILDGLLRVSHGVLGKRRGDRADVGYLWAHEANASLWGTMALPRRDAARCGLPGDSAPANLEWRKGRRPPHVSEACERFSCRVARARFRRRPRRLGRDREARAGHRHHKIHDQRANLSRWATSAWDRPPATRFRMWAASMSGNRDTAMRLDIPVSKADTVPTLQRGRRAYYLT